MKEENKLRLLVYFTVAYILVFLIPSIKTKNYEIMQNMAIMAVLVLIAVLTHKYLNVSLRVWISLSLLGFLNLAGGTFFIGSVRLYDFWFIPGLFKYDNFMHFSAIFVVTIIAYDIISPKLSSSFKKNKPAFSLLLILIALGVGALNEISELVSVILFDATEQVGDYMNNAIDLVFNLLGSIAACFYLLYMKKK
jgi:hypothetical protein